MMLEITELLSFEIILQNYMELCYCPGPWWESVAKEASMKFMCKGNGKGDDHLQVTRLTEGADLSSTAKS